MKKDFLEQRVNFNRKRWGKLFLTLSIILLIGLFFEEQINLYFKIDFLGVFIFMGALIFFIFGISLVSISFGEKYIEGEANLRKHGASTYKYGEIKNKGDIFLVFTLFIIPLFLFVIPYFIIGTFNYDVILIYFMFLSPVYFFIIIKYLGKS